MGVLTRETDWKNEDPSESSLMRQTRVTRILGIHITSHRSKAHTNAKKSHKRTQKYTKGHKKLCTVEVVACVVK